MPSKEKQIKRGAKDEHHEHPWTTLKQAEQIAKDHLKEHPFMYLK
jgi:hypothetical protein